MFVPLVGQSRPGVAPSRLISPVFDLVPSALPRARMFSPFVRVYIFALRQRRRADKAAQIRRRAAVSPLAACKSPTSREGSRLLLLARYFRVINAMT